jgi:hypothetical protein
MHLDLFIDLVHVVRLRITFVQVRCLASGMR